MAKVYQVNFGSNTCVTKTTWINEYENMSEFSLTHWQTGWFGLNASLVKILRVCLIPKMNKMY